MGKNPIQARDTARNAIKRCLDFSKKSDDSADEACVRTYIKVLEDHWSRYLEAQAAVDDSCGTENTKALQETERIQAETWYITSLCNFNRLLLSIGKNIEIKDKTTELNSVRADSSAKLERISIPKFNGNPTEWISFHNLFSSLVEKTMLSGSQKMHYLKGSLQGEALQLIKSFQITDDNYKEAWDLLRKRYNIERVIVEAHLSKISSFPAASSGCATSIKALIDNTQEHARALKALGRPKNQWDDWLVHLVVHKLDSETHKQWELALSQPEVPKFDTLIEFLETRCRSLAAVETHTQELHRKVSVIKSATLNSKLRSTTSAFHTAVSPEQSFHKNQGKHYQSSSQLRKLSCYLCNGNHLIYACQRFISLSISQRRAEIRKRNLCLNCLQPTHMTETCPSIHNCRVCQQRHNTLVHQDKEYLSSSTSSRETTAFVTNVPEFYPKVLLYIAKVRLLDNCGNHQSARALLDTGSQSTFISEQCVQRLGIPRSHASIHVHGLSALDAGTTKGIVSIQLSSSNGTYEISMNALILPKITYNLPNFCLNKTSWEHIHELQLADPEYDNTAAIDLLIGADYIGELLLGGLIKGPPGTPIAQNTQLGWVLSGKLHNFNSIDQHDVVNLHADASLENAITKFWHQEEVPLKSTMTEEEIFCESHYARTYERQADGRYIVRMPLKEEFDLGNSRQAAVQALIRMEKRFLKHPDLHSKYVNFMREYEDLGHMFQDYTPTLPGYSFYLPHHGVIKADSTTTPLRVVFNASMKTTSGNSLNDIQLNGPVLQQPLQTILLRFRSHKFVMTADVTKMFRQVLISKEQINLQRIVWRNTPEEEIRDYCLLTVTYGTNSGTYLAVKTLQQLAIDEGQEFKLAANVVLKDFYVDDLLTGTHDADQLIEAYSQLTAMLERGRFQLRKWSSNHKPLLDIIPDNHRSIANIMRMDEGESIKTLGTYWHPASDLFSFSVDLDNTGPFTKRRLLSKATKIFDPLGLLSPVTISFKILFQRLWRPKVDWDEPLPIDVQKDWDSCYSSLPVLNILRIERWFGIGQPSTKSELHGFADASQQAYAAVIYCRTSYPDGSIKVHLVTAKTRVAPLQTVTLPRLELCAASLLAQLMQQVIEAIDSRYNFYGWTDSTVTLAWIQQAPNKWTTYVCNRVANIQRIMPSHCWHHVRSEHNPADCASRGVGPKDIINHPLWWTGPPWLQQDQSTWPKPVENAVETTLDQRQKSTNTLTNCAIRPQLWGIIDKYSTLQKLLRITAYLLRPLAILQTKQAHRARPRFPQWVLVQELHNAITTWIKLSQSISFSEDVKDCSLGKQLSTRSRLLKLRPFIDEKGLLRVGGRLQNAEASTDTKHPIILDKACKLSKLLAQDIHHGGPQMMMACLQTKYWIVGARALIRGTYYKCLTCRRNSKSTPQQLMGSLPKARVEACRPFLRTGVDFAGPVQLRLSKGRGVKTNKGYIAVFICMATGAMHLELASDLSTQAFIATFRRFCARRGHCAELFSDNGTNFKGAQKELISLHNQAMKDRTLHTYLATDSTTWNFNPPSAPHMGGYWETAVKRVKHHLRRILGETTLTFEEFTTVLTQIESCVNSRPLCAISSSPDDLQALSPAHFLIGEPLVSVPEPRLHDFKGDLCLRWRYVQQLQQHFWGRWSKEYLVSLQQRHKWTRSTNNIKVGDLVAIKDDRLPPTKWRLGRVSLVHPGQDNLVRVITLKTSNGFTARPISKVCPLISNDIPE